jgi:hypothetical protein
MIFNLYRVFMKNNYFKIIPAVCLLSPAIANADIQFNGFASITAGATIDSDTTAQGFTDDLDFKPGSLFALQARSDLGEGLSATAQIIAEGSDDFEARFEWAYVSYELNDNNTLSAGKFRYPQYVFSDYLDVRFAYHWITPPTEVYQRFITSIDGITLINNNTLGSWDVTSQFWYGRSTNFIDTAVRSEFNEMFGFNTLWNRDWLTLRAVYVQGELVLPFTALEDFTAPLIQAGFGDVANEFSFDGDLSYAGVGFQADFDKFFLMGEYTDTTFANKYPGNPAAYYVSAGFRMSDWTFHYTYSGRDADPDASFVLEGIPDIPQLAPLRGAALAILGPGEDEEAHTVGFRYDFHPSAAFKMEYRTFEDNLNELQDVNLLRASVDLVF